MKIIFLNCVLKINLFKNIRKITQFFLMFAGQVFETPGLLHIKMILFSLTERSLGIPPFLSWNTWGVLQNWEEKLSPKKMNTLLNKNFLSPNIFYFNPLIELKVVKVSISTAFFILKQIVHLFSNYSLALWLYGKKRT